MKKKDMEIKAEFKKVPFGRKCLTKCPFNNSAYVGSFSCTKCEAYKGNKGNTIYCQKQGELKAAK